MSTLPDSSDVLETYSYDTEANVQVTVKTVNGGGSTTLGIGDDHSLSLGFDLR